ncbi:MAG TPA: glycoside hydrolase family 38 C-terminal domain-containing protein, partial [Candidatus Dormibacteraeota bacterium]|nr:glycoside hydrolase family 38 C-terminal domain-containing protein [Candidatus Dormibacteraeota bacterium]
MRRHSASGTPIVLGILICALPGAGLLDGQQRAIEATPGKKEVYVLPFSHLDLFWAGTREECLARGNRIIAKAMDIAKKYPEFHFFLESDNFVANFVESHKGSSEVDDLKRLVREGRFGIAPNWANIFHNLPDGEVHARNFLYGRRYAHEVFGVDPAVFQPADIPGFTPQFPQLLQQTNIPFMVMTRIGPQNQWLFDWKSPNGSKVLVWNEPHGYGWGAHLGFHSEMTSEKRGVLEKELREVSAYDPGPIFVPWGIDLWSPNEKIVQNVDALNKDFTYAHFTLAVPQDFFKAVEKTPNLPEISGEIPMAWPHVVDGILHLWQLAVPATTTLSTAEEFATVNYALGYADYPQQDLELLWKSLIESMDHNHDGQGGEIGDRRKMDDSLLVLNRGGEILRDSLRNIAERVRLPITNGFPLVVFNGLAWERNDPVRAHVTLYGDVGPYAIDDYKKGMRLVDEKGTPIPFHLEQTSENISRALELTFIATRVPALGYKTYFLTPGDESQSFPPATEFNLDRDKDQKDPRRPLGTDVMENQFYRVTVDKATGKVTVLDKGLNQEIVKGAEIVGAEERGTNNVQKEIDTGRVIPLSPSGTQVEENNPVRAILRLSGWIADIPIQQRLILYRGLKRLDIENSLDWKEPRFLRIEQQFPLGRTQIGAEYGIPFGANSVANIMPGSGPHAGDEIQQEAWKEYRTIQSWVFAGDNQWGLTLAADHQLMKLEDGLIHANMIRGQRYTSVKIV